MVELLCTFMEMRQPPVASLDAPAGVSVGRERPDAEEYLTLYRLIGEPVQWDARTRMPRAELDAILTADTTAVHILRAFGEPVGMCEFLDVGKAEVELANFGIVPAAYGKGYGSFLLNRALHDCWLGRPDRIWLRTDTNDHANAVATYEKAGFAVCKRAWQTFPD